VNGDTGRRPLGLVACGALVRNVIELTRRRGWDADVHGIAATHHLRPARIAEAVEAKLAELDGRYDRVVVVYGDCGTVGALDRVLARHGAVRPEGPHCYEMYAGDDFGPLVAERDGGTYVLTDWLVRNWERAVVRSLGLDRRPSLSGAYFGGFRRVLHLRQAPDPALDDKARGIAASLGLPLETRDTGLGDLERRLVSLVEG